jgi:hypothetical protein
MSVYEIDILASLGGELLRFQPVVCAIFEQLVVATLEDMLVTCPL